MSQDDQTYLLQMNQRQAEVIQEALDLYARIRAGQLEELRRYHMPDHDMVEHYHPARVDYCIETLKSDLFGLSQHASFSVLANELPDEVRVAWDIKLVIRYRLAWDRAGNPPQRDIKTMGTVDFDEPQQSSQEPLPSFENITGDYAEATRILDRMEPEIDALERRVDAMLAKHGELDFRVRYVAGDRVVEDYGVVKAASPTAAIQLILDSEFHENMHVVAREFLVAELQGSK